MSLWGEEDDEYIGPFRVVFVSAGVGWHVVENGRCFF